MLHDRLYSEWNQPTGNVAAGAKLSALVHLRIEKDGRVSRFEVVRSSGNAAVDASIEAAGKRVTAVDALPDGLGTGDHYEVNIKFELSGDE
jgi:TonB family protein